MSKDTRRGLRVPLASLTLIPPSGHPRPGITLGAFCHLSDSQAYISLFCLSEAQSDTPSFSTPKTVLPSAPIFLLSPLGETRSPEPAALPRRNRGFVSTMGMGSRVEPDGELESNPRHLANKRGEPTTEVLRFPPLNQGLPGQIANCIKSIGVFFGAIGIVAFLLCAPPPLPHSGRVQWMVLLWVAKLIRQGAVVLPLFFAE